MALENKEKLMCCKHLYYVKKFPSKVNYDNNKVIHTPTYTYNKVMRSLVLVGVVEHK